MQQNIAKNWIIFIKFCYGILKIIFNKQSEGNIFYWNVPENPEIFYFNMSKIIGHSVLIYPHRSNIMKIKWFFWFPHVIACQKVIEEEALNKFIYELATAVFTLKLKHKICQHFTISHINYWDQLNSWKNLWKLWNCLLYRNKSAPSLLLNILEV